MKSERRRLLQGAAALALPAPAWAASSGLPVDDAVRLSERLER